MQATAVTDDHTGTPALTLRARECPRRMDAMQLVLALQNGTPSIHADPARVDEGEVLFNAAGLREHEVAPLARRLQELLEVAS